jgi:hypothetical protein
VLVPGPDSCASDLEVQDLAREIGVPTREFVGPTICRLARQCCEQYQAWLRANPHAAPAQCHGEAAYIVSEMIRLHYKSALGQQDESASLKSDNKRYSPDSPVARRDERELRAFGAGGRIEELERDDATLEAFVAERVGNCGIFAALAVELVRNLGLSSNAWEFGAPSDPHVFCVVGPVAPEQEAALACADGVWIIDRWAGLCSVATEFLPRFENKMKQWASPEVRKQVAYQDPTGRVRWVSPDSEEWAALTYRTTPRKIVQPMLGYEVE